MTNILRTLRAAVVLGLIAAATGCATPARGPVPGDARVERAARALHLETALAHHPLPASGRRKDVLDAGGDRSTHLVQLTKPLPLHIHPARTEFAHVLRGHGTMTLGDRAVALAPGVTVRIDAGVVHGVDPEAGEVLVAVVQYDPPQAVGDDSVWQGARPGSP